MKSKRILMSIIGVMIGAVSVGFFKLAAFGVDPFQSFMSGTNQMFPINFGTLYVIVNVTTPLSISPTASTTSPTTALAVGSFPAPLPWHPRKGVRR